MKHRREKVTKSRPGWRKSDQVRRIKIVMTVVSTALCISVAAGAILVWTQIHRPADAVTAGTKPASSAPLPSESDELPVYDDTYNLLLVNSANALKSDFAVQTAELDGVTVDGRILPALKKMMADAEADGCALKLTGGYVDTQQQGKLFQAAVQSLMKNQKYSQVRAENEAQNSIGKAGYNEFQTGMAMTFSADGLKPGTDFSTTAQYKWLMKNSVRYGFVLRTPADKAEITGRAPDPGHFRYVGTDNAMKMREYNMCLEEYSAYRQKQAAG